MQQYGKYYITLKGVHYEVSQEVHDAFYQAERQERYMAEKDQSHNLVILNISGMEELEEGRNQEHLASSQHGMESELIKKEMVEHLHQCLQMLPKAERVGLTQSGVSRKCKMILAKLKKFMNKL